MKYFPRFLSIAAALCLLGASAKADNGPYSGGGPYSGNGTSKSGGSSITLTTTGSSGASTLVGSNLNVPNYASAVASPSTVYPESYGAVGNGGFYFDGAFTATSPLAAIASTSTTPTTPAVTTITNSDQLVSVFSTQLGWTTTPSVGTTRVNLAYASNRYGILVSDQTISSAGVTTPILGTVSGSSDWQTASIALVPSGSISFISSNTESNSGIVPTVSLTKPTGTTSGDYLIACISYYNGHNFALSVKPPLPGWDYLTSTYNAIGNHGSYLNCFGRAAGASEPASYMFTIGASGGNSAVILDYRGTSGPDTPTTTLTSATASFSSTTSGDPICVSGISGGGANVGQKCGTITAYNSPTSVNVSFNVYNTFTGKQFSFGSSDQSAFNTMLTTAPCSTVGCQINLQAKHYTLTAPLVFKYTIPISLVGIAPSVPNTAQAFISGGTIVNANNGTVLDFDTQSMTQAALLYTATVGTSNSTTTDIVSNLTVYGGAGNGFDGGGSDGIDVLNWQGFYLNNVYSFNFNGQGFYEDGLSSATFFNYTEAINLTGLYSSFNGGAGLKVGGLAGVQDLESIVCNSCIIEANGGPGVLNVGGNIQAETILNSTIQWDNIYFANSEISTTGVVGGGSVRGNYVEVNSGVLDSQSTTAFGNTGGMIGMDVGGNYVQGSGNYVPVTYSAAGTALPSCTNSNYIGNFTATVSDATQCLNGTTYVNGGTYTCRVTCNGTNWVESVGSGPYSGEPLTTQYLSLTSTAAVSTVGSGVYLSAANTLDVSTSGAKALEISTTGNAKFIQPPAVPGYIVSTLPSGIIGMRAYVTDQTSACPSPGGSLTGSGSVTCPVFFNGSAWVGD